VSQLSKVPKIHPTLLVFIIKENSECNWISVTISSGTVAVGGPVAKVPVFQMVQISLLSILIYFTRCEYDILKVLFKKKTGTFLLSVSNIDMFCANKKFHFTCCFELFFEKPEHMHMDHLKYVKLLIYVCERSMQGFGTRFQHQVCCWGY
jgi:hypothetical protein